VLGWCRVGAIGLALYREVSLKKSKIKSKIKNGFTKVKIDHEHKIKMSVNRHREQAIPPAGSP
jgi:hypothetical protein